MFKFRHACDCRRRHFAAEFLNRILYVGPVLREVISSRRNFSIEPAVFLRQLALFFLRRLAQRLARPLDSLLSPNASQINCACLGSARYSSPRSVNSTCLFRMVICFQSTSSVRIAPRGFISYQPCMHLSILSRSSAYPRDVKSSPCTTHRVPVALLNNTVGAVFPESRPSLKNFDE